MASSKLVEEGGDFIDSLFRCTFGLTKLMTVRCAIELGIPDIVENHPNGITLADLSSQVGCPEPSLHRIMRFLIHHGFFERLKSDDPDSPIAYTPTTLSHLITKDKMASLLLFASNAESFACKLTMSSFLVSKNKEMTTAFEAANGANIWQYAMANPAFKQVFNKGLGFIAKQTISVLLENYKAVFDGINCLVDVGGGDGSALRAIVKACPGIVRAVNFDLPHVVSESKDDHDCLEYVGGNMLESVPKADAALIKSVLHDWDDETCVKILKNIKEAIPMETGKVIIVESVMDDDVLNEEGGGDDNKYREYHLSLDIEMMVQTSKGKRKKLQGMGGHIKHCRLLQIHNYTNSSPSICH